MIIIEIATTSAAFEGDVCSEVERILADLTVRLRDNHQTDGDLKLYDRNGNVCGEADIFVGGENE